MERIKNCRACNSEDLALVLDLGSTPLANSLVTKEELNKTEFKAPLEVLLCETCSLVQISCTIPPERLFRNYAYFSSFSETMLKHAEDLCARLKGERNLGAESFVVEIASNDGYLLKNYNQSGVPTLGIEPALNVAKVAQSHGIETITEFFDSKLAKKIVETKGKADVVHAHNVLAHVPDINSILKGVHIVLKDTGIAVIEAPYVVKMVDKLEFDTIYHEHVFYFSVTAINNVLKRNSLVLVDVEQVEIHGGSLRMFIAKNGEQSPTVLSMLEEERARGFDGKRAYKSFAKQVISFKDALIDLIRRLKREGKKLAVYGAAAKGSTLLNYCGLGLDVFDFVVDRSTAKQGYYMPGIQLPIYDPVELIKQKPDYVLLLTWNFAEEILRQQAEYTKQGGLFILPIPEPKILATDVSPIYA